MIPYSSNIDSDLWDAGQRISDAINQKIADHGWWDIRNKFMAFALADGHTDGVLYDTKRDAVRHQKNNEKQYVFVTFRSLGGGARPKDCAILVKFNRDLYKAGYRMPDPDDVNGGPTPIMTARWNDFYNGRLSRPMPRESALWLPKGIVL